VSAATPDDQPLRSLDQAFGVCLAPSRVDDVETIYKPKSLHRLDAESAKLMKRLIDVTEEGLRVTRYVYSELPLLWVVDGRGDIWFSLEEVVDRDGNYLFPKPSRVPVATPSKKLGHPSLIGGEQGRIGGEILYDTGAAPPRWFITNRSGRYGVRAGRTPEHLANVARMFGAYGIEFAADFYPPPDGAL